LVATNDKKLFDLLLEKSQGQKISYYLDEVPWHMSTLASQHRARIFTEDMRGQMSNGPVLMIDDNARFPSGCGIQEGDPCCQGYWCASPIQGNPICGECDHLTATCHHLSAGTCSPSSTGTGTGPGTGGGGTNQPPCGTSDGAKCCAKDQCGKGFACDVGSQTCHKVGPGCGGIGQPCCAASSANPEGCSFSKCYLGVCQPCGNKGEICCGGTTTTQFCGTGLTCNGVDCH